jgi:diguanylate cyclase (GGDEF)-like protein/putative nucleotidyltransferase with HDIG domain
MRISSVSERVDPAVAGGVALPWEDEPHETSGLTSRLILSYVERKGGRQAVERVLELAGLAAVERDLWDEGHWFSFATKIRLFEAAAEVLDDPDVPRHIGEQAVDFNVGEGLKVTLRALGSPRLVYENVVRANGKFSTTARMDLLEVSSSHARIAYVDVTGTPFHRLDCQYNIGMLSCVPALFGLPLARVSHPICAGDGGDSCVYHVTWEPGGSYVRFALGSLLSGAAAVIAAALVDPALLPEAGAMAASLAALAGRRTFQIRRRRWRQLEDQVRWQGEVAQKLSASLQDIVSELRLEEVLPKVTANARSTLVGRQFVLLVEEDGELRCRASAGLPLYAAAPLERWAAGTARLAESPILLDDLAEVPSLAELPSSVESPLRSLCAAPLRYRGESLGVLVALSPNPYSLLPRDVEVIQSFASQAAIAVSNAVLYQAQQELASRDPLTGLFNHREFHESVARELDRCRRYGGRMSVVLFDLDGFKSVNDVAGHAEGDSVLRATAERLAATCRSSDTAFRIGGDEFALLLPETTAADAADVGARAAAQVAAIREPVDVSYGLGVWPDDGPSKDTLLARADRQLYEMKRERGRVDARNALLTAATLWPAAGRERRRLALASSLSARLAPLLDPAGIVRATVEELARTYDCDLALILRLDEDDRLRPVASAGPLTGHFDAGRDWSLSTDEGVTGRVARTGEPALLRETHDDPDFLGPDEVSESGSELTLPIRVAGRVWGVLDIESTRSDAFGEEDLLLADTLAAQVGGALHRCELFAELESTFATTLGVLSDALEMKDSYTPAHADDVAEVAVRVGRRLGVPEDELRVLRYGALLHDIGKIGVRSEVLNKPTPLTREEFEEIKQHTVIGAEMLERIPFFAPVQPLLRSAHERFDGGGYPDGLAGDEIPLGARIVCACDAFHAMTSERPYSEARTLEGALAELRHGAGRQFDPAVVEALIAEVEAGL